MSSFKQLSVSGRDYYEHLYASGLEMEAEWLRRGAAHKVDSVEGFLRRRCIEAETIMELGCGPGEIVRECQRRNLARRYVGVDYSAEAIAYLRTRSPDITGLQADITSPDLELTVSPDVVILSHVLEHLENPDDFLAAALRKIDFDYLIVEVPLEDLPGARLKDLVKDRRINTSGHVQFFNPTSFLHLLGSHGLEVLEHRRYVPILDLDTMRFLRAKEQLSQARFMRMVAGSALSSVLSPLWSRLYYSHYAVLCTRGEAAGRSGAAA